MTSSRRPNLTMRSTALAARILLTLPLITAAGWAHADTKPLGDAPLGKGALASTVLPNVAMVLDDSSSMTSNSMPDEADDHKDRRCYGYKGYNTLAYDPTLTYKPPYDPNKTGERFPSAVFAKALHDGYFAKDATAYDTTKNTEKDLATEGNRPYANKFTEKIKGEDVTTTTRYYYSTYSGTMANGTCDTNDTKFTLITDPASIQAPSGVNALVNYANWYSYYRQRNYLMKAATGEAFSTISDKYRVGLFFIHTEKTPTKIDTFTGTHRNNWYQHLYSHTYTSGTPLLGALSEMGRMYAGRNATYGDPVQFSCQQNFTILSSDGYWNRDASWMSESQKIASRPKNLDGSVMTLDQDGVAGVEPPYKDASKVAGTLADVAYYYYSTDLRDGSYCSNSISGDRDLCANNVPGSGANVNDKQHMITFTVGLGVNGTLPYTPETFASIKAGSTPWPNPTTGGDIPEKIDDLWHAAVNGRGNYYSAGNPTTLVAGLRSALAGVSARLGSGAAAATSNLEPVAGDSAVYMATYRSVKWDGDLRAYQIDPTTGHLVDPDAYDWSAQEKIDTQVRTATSGDGRAIKYFSKATRVTNNLRDFTFTNLTADGKNAYFENVCTKLWLTQCSDGSTGALDATQKTLANAGDNLVNYLRGRATYEDKKDTTAPLFRAREHVLGDPVNAMPVYVQKPQFDYGKYDATYNGFKTDQAERLGNVYMAANDGMLHAINSANGEERWAYVPSFVMPTMHKLADKAYGHQFSVDGSPTVGDVCATLTADACKSKGDWKTILIGGLNKGGCGYYALDVTDPANPKGLWEFENDYLGYSYGNPIITRRASDKKWVAIFTSGYNNIPATCGKANADGVGRVFVVDAMTGTLLQTISTGVGSVENPSNLGKLNAWVNDAQANIADSVYGGDMLGNLWRIDFDDNASMAPSGREAFKLAALGQPITVKPELAEVKGGHRVVMVGTGRLLHADDLTNTTTQSIYGLKDDLAATSGIGDPRSTANEAVIKKRTFAAGTTSEGQTIRTVTGDDINWATDKGWYVDLSATGERLNVDMQLQYNILTAATNVPQDDECTTGGYAWLNYFDIDTGKNLITATDSAVSFKQPSNSLIVGIKAIKLGDNKTATIVSRSDGTLGSEDPPSATGTAAGGARRTMWREILD